MSWGNLTSEQKQLAYDALNEKAQPLRDYVTRDTTDLQGAIAAGQDQGMIDILTQNIANWNTLLQPLEDALSLLGYAAPA